MSILDQVADDPFARGAMAPTMSGDAPAAPGSLYDAVRSSGAPLLSDTMEATPAQAGSPRKPVYADPEDPTAPKAGALGDMWQLDPDPTGDATVMWGQKNGEALSNRDILSLNIGGGRMVTKGELAQTDDGRKLLALAERQRLGIRRDFFDAMNPLEWGPDKLPFVSLFATVGKSISDAKTVSNTFEKLQNGEPVTNEELIKTSLYINQERERSQGTWGATVGDILSQAPGFMAEFFASGGLLAAARKGAVGALAKDGSGAAVKKLSHFGLTRAQKVLADETADQAVKAGISGYAKQVLGGETADKLTQAATEFAANKALRKDAVKAVADILEKNMLSAEAAFVTGADSWAPGVARKVAEARAEQAIANAMMQRTASGAVRKAMRSTGRALADSVSRGLMDVGSWGTDTATVMFTDRSPAGRALMDGLSALFIEAPLKGGELYLANKAVTAPISLALGGTVGRQELAVRQAAYQNNDDDLMRKAGAIGMGLDMLEYISENTGRGFKSLGSAAALAVAPELARTGVRQTAGKVAGRAVADILREPSEAGWKATGATFSGLFDPSEGKEVGGLISRYVSKVLGQPEDYRAVSSADRYTAVARKLGPDVRISNPAALEASLREGVFQPGVDDAVKAAIGPDIEKFAKTALKEAYDAKAEGMKLNHFFQYYIADFMARKQIGAKTAMDLFQRMGYDGIAGEMLEERYSDVVSSLLGLDAEKDHSFGARIQNAVKAAFPGWDQLTAEAVGFAFPMVARAGTIRALNAIGGEGAYSRYRNNAALYQDAVRHGTVGTWRLGDAIEGYERQLAAAETETAKTRIRDYHKAFMDSLTEAQRNDLDAEVAYAPLSAETAALPEAEFNRRIRATAAQARGAASAQQTLVKGAAEMGQTLYKMQSIGPGENAGFFRKAAHWVVKSAGALMTGDPGLMAMNPAQWHGVDVGLPDTVQDALRVAYGNIYEAELAADQRARAAAAGAEGSPHEADMESAHARALEKFRPIAEQLMAVDLAAHQTYMFSDAEMKDVAMDEIAKARDLAPDAKAREYVSVDGTRTSFEDFYAQHEEEINETRKKLAAQAFDLFTSGSLQQGRVVFKRRGDDAIAIADVVDVPKDLPTRDQAILATLLKHIPGMRNILRAHEVDPDKSIDDQLGGMATRQAWLDKLAESAMPGGIITPGGLMAALANADKIDPVVAEAVARDLNFQYDGTEEGLAERNRNLVRVAILSKALQDPNVRVYAREGAIEEGRRDASQWSEFQTARRRSDGQWAYRKADGTTAVAADEAALDAELAKAENGSWSPTAPRMVFTAAQLLQSSDAITMIEALGLKKRYAAELAKRASKNPYGVDPMFRVEPDENGKDVYVYTKVEDMNAERERQKALAKEYIDNHKQNDPNLYRREGESVSTGHGNLDDARDAYEHLYGKNGYITIANELLRRQGVSVPMEGTGISAGMLNADLRGKYILSVNAFRSRNQSGNVYVPINHEVAQNYESAILNATLVDAYFKNRRTLADVYESGVRNFVNAVDAIAAAKAEAKDTPEALRQNLQEFRAAVTFDRNATGRRLSPQGFALLTSAYALFQTEREGNAKSVLGDFAPALKAIAEQVRSDKSFYSFVGAVDRVFGGSGFNAALVRAQGGVDATRGVARMFALFAPTDSRSFYDAVEKAAPGGLSADEFVRRVADADMSAWNSARPRKTTKSNGVAPPSDAGTASSAEPTGGKPKSPKNPPTPPAGLEAVAAVQSKAAETGADVDDIIDRVIGPAPAPKVSTDPSETPVGKSKFDQDDDMEVRLAKKALAAKRKRIAENHAAIDAGNASEATVETLRADQQDVDAIARTIAERDAARKTPQPAASAGDVVRDAEDEEEVEEDDGKYYVAENFSSLVDVEGTATDADSEPKPVEVRDKADLTEAEMKALMPILGTMCTKVDGHAPNAERFVKFLNKLAPWMRRRDLQQFTRLFVEGYSEMTEQDLEALWTWPEDDVEEGALPDGYEESNAKSVKALKDNKALNNFLALASVVNPHTGRQFQAFMEDLRSTVARSLRNAGALDQNVREALEFVDRLVNPRANDAATPALRDAFFADLLSGLTSGENEDQVTNAVTALLKSDRPANRKAAVLLGYLASMPGNVRRQMTQLVSSAAPSAPVRLNVSMSYDGKPTFLIEQRNGADSRLSVSAVSALYGSFAGRSKAKCVEAADALDKAAQEMIAAGKLGMPTGKDRRANLASAFSDLADLLAAQFGDDCPLVSVLGSKNVVAAIAANDSQYQSMSSGFTVDQKAKVPYFVAAISNGLRYLAEQTHGDTVSEETAALTSVLVNTMGDPRTGGMTFQTNTAKTPDRLATLFSVFDTTMPRSIMNAEVDPVRTNKPSSSVAITMRGVEPAVQVFMDRQDANGFRAVCERFFPEFAKLPEELKRKSLGVCRQSMCWPVAGRPEIIAKCLSKTAYSREVYAGCQTRYDIGKALHVNTDGLDAETANQRRGEARAKAVEKFGFETVSRYYDNDTLYVPVYSGDHSSSIIIAVPFASRFYGKMSYDEAAREVSGWVGLDLLGVEAKRSATTCLEAPGVGFIGFKRNPDGTVATKPRARPDFGISEFHGRKVEWVDDIVSADGKGRHIAAQYNRSTKVISVSKKNVQSTFAERRWEAPAHGKPLPAGLINTEQDLLEFTLLHETAHAERGARPSNVPVGDWEDRMNQYAIGQMQQKPEPETGECRVNIVWCVKGGNESMLGTTLGHGYGMEQLKLCAKDPKSSTLKFHAMNTASSGKYGANLSLIKSLNVSPGENGDFPEFHPARAIMEFLRKQRSKDAKWSTSIATDFDSVKLALANSKMMGVLGKNGKTKPLMEYVFDRIKTAIDSGAKLKDSYEGDELDALVGEFEWRDNAVASRSIPKAKVSDILDGVRIDRVDGLDGEAFSLSYVDNDLMGFQVANVSHKSVPKSREGDYGRAPRNYMVDAFTMAQVLLRGWNADAAAKAGRPTRRKNESAEEFNKRLDDWKGTEPVFTDMESAVNRMQNLIAAWGSAATDLASRPETARCLMEDSSDAQEAREHGEPEGGRFMRGILARALATHLTKNLNIPLRNIAAPLVSNMSWIGEDGLPHSHSQSQMFNDTLMGSRTIPLSARRFYRGHRQMALCNMNCSDPSFRYGMYCAKTTAELKQQFADVLAGYEYESGGEDTQAVEIFDRVFTHLRDVEDRLEAEQKALDSRTKEQFKADPGAYVDWSEAHDIRLRIAQCFTDHHGNDLSKRKRTFTVTTKDAEGNKTKTQASALWCDEVSFDDLFTRLRLTPDGKPTFDRTAFYFDMHRDAPKSADGKPAPATTHLYLGGTMVGLPRTPSYNGSMWLQTVRAALPVTEVGEPEHWGAGYDAMVAPDPYTLAILGCDHDGDKTNLYMLNAPSRCANQRSAAKRRQAAAQRFLDDKVIADGDFSQFFERRQVRVDKTTKLLREWQMSDLGKMQVSNTFVQGLFDMSRALPLVDNTDNEAPFYNGTTLNTSNSGCVAPGTKAIPVPKKMWEEEVLKNPEAIGDPLLDAKSGKTVHNSRTAAIVGDGAKNAADARAIAVSLASALHIAWASGLFADSLFHAGRNAEGARAWLDFMHHLDGFSNMTFDDIKEQVCSRLGVTAGTMDTIVADMINASLLKNGKPPRTDREFLDAFLRYAKDVRKGGARAWVRNATDKMNYAMQRRLASMFGQEPTTYSVCNLFGITRNAKGGLEFTVPTAKYGGLMQLLQKNAKSAAEAIGASGAGAFNAVMRGIVSGVTRDYSDTAGFLGYLVENPTDENAKDFVQWFLTKSTLQDAKSFARSVNYVTADPGSNNASTDEERRENAFDRLIYDKEGGYTELARSIPREQLARLERMHDWTMKAYRLSDAKTVADYAASSLASYEEDFSELAEDVAASAPKDLDAMAAFATRLIGAERLRRTDVLQSQANAQMVGLAVAAVRTLRQTPGSKMTPANALRVLKAISDGANSAIFQGKERRNGRYQAPTLDMMRGIEDLFELMYRLTMSSTARDTLPIFTYFSERGDSGARSFNEIEYYGVPETAMKTRAPRSRITLAFQGVTEGQMTAVRELYNRVVAGELDAAERTDVHTKSKSKFGFSLSQKSLDALIEAMDTKRADGYGLKFGADAKVVKALAVEAKAILDQLKPVLGETEITPSMMFGQLLPLYAALSTRTDRVPDSRSSSLVTAMGDTYSTWATELARLDADPKSARALRMMTGVNWAMPNLLKEGGEGEPGHVRPARKSRAVFNKSAKAVAAKMALGQFDARAARRSLATAHQELTNPRGRYVIDVFGNNELFQAALDYFNDPKAASSLLEDTPVPVATPASAAKPLPAGYDPYVAELANRMTALLRPLSGAEVEYKGGSSFIIRSRLTGRANGVRTAVKVSVFCGQASDARVLEITRQAGWRASVAARAGVSRKQISDWLDASSTTDAQRIAFYRKYEPQGHTTKAGDWAVDYKKAGVLCNEIQLRKQDGDPSVIYHEYFHSMMRFFRDERIGALTDADLTALARRYHKDKYDAEVEEKAAYEFQEFVKSGEAHESVKSVFEKILALIRGLFRSLYKTGVKSSDFGKNMNENPLAVMTLTGSTFKSEDDVTMMSADVKAEADATVNGDAELDADDSLVERILRAKKAKRAKAVKAEAASKSKERAEEDDIEDRLFAKAAARKAVRAAQDGGNAAKAIAAELDANVYRGPEIDNTPFGDEDNISDADVAAYQAEQAELKGMEDMNLAFAVGKPVGTEALDRIFPDRFEGEYAPLNTVARAVGMAVRNGLRESGLDPEAASVLQSLGHSGKVKFAAALKAAVDEAIRRVAAAHNIDLGKGRRAKGSKRLRNLVYNAMLPVVAGCKAYNRTDGNTSGPVEGSGPLVTSADLASAIMVSCGMQPRHLVLAAREFAEAVEQRNEGSQLAAVANRCASALRAIEMSDPTALCTSNEEQERLVGQAIHELSAGLEGGHNGAAYTLGTIGASKNEFHDRNIGMYGSYIESEEFQQLMHRTLDTMYTLLAGMKFYRQCGFEPGDSKDSGVPPAEAKPQTADQTAARLGVEARQLLDRDMDVVEYMDQPAFVANNLDAYLQSTVRSTFGKVPVGELMQALHNKAHGYVLRLNNAENWLASMYGQNVLPGQKLHSATVVEGKFAMEEGKVVAKAGGKHIRFELYRGKHENVRLTEDEHRLVDLLFKADKAKYQGADALVTGVDEIVFSPDDSFKPADYTREKVRERLANHEQLSAIDRALLRLSDCDTPQLPEFLTDGEGGLRENFVKAACEVMEQAHRSALAMQNGQRFNDYVLRRLEDREILMAHQRFVVGERDNICDKGVLVVPVKTVDDLFASSSALDKLVAARRNIAETEAEVREMLRSREFRTKPLDSVYREFAQFVNENPWLTDGDGRFFTNMKTPLTFVQGTGVFMYNANRKTRRDDSHKAADKLTAEEEKFLNVMRNDNAGPDITGGQLRYLADMYKTVETSAEELRQAIKDGLYKKGTERSRRTGLVLDSDADFKDVSLALYNRLVEAAWRENGDPVTRKFGGIGPVKRIVDAMESDRLKDQTMTGRRGGMSDLLVYRINGELPANHQLAHAIHNQMEGVANALVFRSTLISMMMTPDGKGRPTVYANPSLAASEAGGVPDQVWGTIARWWAETNPMAGAVYDESKSGVENAKAVYERIHDSYVKNGRRLAYEGSAPGVRELVPYGEISGEDIDAKSISGILAQTDNKGAGLNSLGGGYALGYAKHLLQASRTLGSAAQRAVMHRALGWSKSMSVSFSFFFPLATKYESPWGAVGATAMLGSNHFSETVRKNPEMFNAIQKAFGGRGWLTKDFLGFKDIIEMMDSDDPFLGELYSWASALGVSLSDSRVNPIEPQRAIVQRDLATLREMVRDRMGAKAAARFDSVTRALLLRTGDKAFTYALNATKLATVAQLCMKLRAEAEEKGIAFDPVRDLRRYVGYVNAEIGGIDPLKYAWAHPMNRGIMSMLMFSWEWTRGAWEAGGGGVIEDFLFGGHSMTAEERKYIVGRWARMFGGVMIGVPLMFQILIKALAVAMGHDDDDEKWFTWQNEDKAMWTAFDLTPLMKAMSERFPKVAQWKKDHPVLGAMLPMYTGSDRANRKFGSLDPETGRTYGRHYYMHFGKQGWEEFRWFTNPTGQFFSKLSMPTQRMLEGIFGRSLSWLDHELPWNDMGFVERWLNPSLDSATANLVKAFLPFTLSGLTDRGDAGLLSAFGPVQMGASATATQDKIVDILRKWAYDDRRGYAPANPTKGKFAHTITGMNSSVRSLVEEAMRNGASRKDAYTIVGTAVGRLTASLYGELMDALPQRADGPFDAARVTKCVRAINRLGRKRKDVIDAVKDRLKQKRTTPSRELADRWNAILREGFNDPYGTGAKGL